MSIDRRIVKATERLEADVTLTYKIVNGDETTEVSTEGGPVPSHAKVAKDSRLEIIGLLKPTVDSINKHAVYVDNRAKAAQQEAARAAAAADRAKEISGIKDVQEALRRAAVPAPDFHLPLISDLHIREGFGPADRIDVSPKQDGSVMVDLPTRSAQFSRASIATYINKSGVLKIAAINEPRFEKEGILLEGPSTNIITNSENLNGSGWVTNNATVTEGAGFGDVKSWVVTRQSDTGSLSFVAMRGLSIPARKLTTKVRFKTDESAVRVFIRTFDDSRNILCERRINLDDLTVDGSSVGLKSENVELVNGWYEYALTVDATAPSNEFRITLYAKNDTNGIASTEYATVQVEALPLATSYIPTNGSSVTRNDENLSVPLENNVIKNEMTISSVASASIQGSQLGDSVGRRVFSVSSGTQRLAVYLGPSARSIRSALNGLGAVLGSLSSTKSLRSTVRYDGTGNTLFADGRSATQSSRNTGDLGDTLYIGRSSANSRNQRLHGHVRDFSIWHKALSDEQISALGD